MSRNFFIQAHLLLAALFTPIILLTVISGGLYLLGVKGSVKQSAVTPPPGLSIDLSSAALETDVRQLLAQINPNYSFEYLKVKGNTLYTRPTSKPHYELRLGGKNLKILHNSPSLQSALVELHKGHGPRNYKTLQKIMAGGLVFVVLSGMWLGLSSRILRVKTITMLTIGTAVMVALAIL